VEGHSHCRNRPPTRQKWQCSLPDQSWNNEQINHASDYLCSPDLPHLWPDFGNYVHFSPAPILYLNLKFLSVPQRWAEVFFAFPTTHSGCCIKSLLCCSPLLFLVLGCIGLDLPCGTLWSWACGLVTLLQVLTWGLVELVKSQTVAEI
jgi:hypothetical protein